MQILLIAPDFYDYHLRIVAELRSRGHSITYFAERPARWIYSPAKKLGNHLRRRVFDAYLRGILRETSKTKFDRVIVIRGEILTGEFVERLRASQRAARFTLYEWDSYRVTDFRHLLPLFDATASFDSLDSAELGIGYLPLFYIPQYCLPGYPLQPQIDLTFVGSFHDSRYRALKGIQSYCQSVGIKLSHYLYLSPVDYIKLALKGKQPPLSDVQFRKLDQPAILERYRSACSILDIENNKQAGLTMRTFEALATGRNLVTTNPLALTLLPSLSHRIVLIDRDSLQMDPLRVRRVPGPGPELAPFSLSAWTDHLLDL